MIKKLLLLVVLFNIIENISAQCPFVMPDTVCVNQLFEITNYDSIDSYTAPCGKYGKNKHQWYYESAAIDTSSAPVFKAVNATGDYPANWGATYIASVREKGRYYTFATGWSNYIYRNDYGTKVNSISVCKKVFVSGGYLAFEGIKMVNDNGKWFGFVTAIGGANDAVFRIEFDSINDDNPVVTNLNIPSVNLVSAHEIELQQENDVAKTWYAIIGNENDTSFVILKFVNGLAANPSTIEIKKHSYSYTAWQQGSSKNGLSGLTIIKAKDKWHMLCGSNRSGVLYRVDFDEGFTNPKYTNLGNPSNALTNVSDVSFIHDCNYLMAMVTNEETNGGDGNLAILRFDSSITGTLHGKAYFNPTLIKPHAISEVYHVRDTVYSFVINAGTGKIALLQFASGTSHIPFPIIDTTFAPMQIKYNTPGRYNISMVVDNDVSNTFCQTIFVVNPPLKPIDIDPKWVCVGQTLNAFPAVGVNSNRIRYNWVFPDVSSHTGRNPVVGTSGYYILANAFDQCVGDTIKRFVKVSDRPAPPEGTNKFNCPENGALTAITASKLSLNDSVFWYGDPLLKQLLSKTITNSTTPTFSSFIPKDSTAGVFDYFVVRKPLNTLCSRIFSDSIKVLLTLKRPTAPLVDMDQTFCLGDDFTTLYLPQPTVSNVYWYDNSILDTIRNKGNAWKPVFTHGGVFIFYATSDSSGCRSNAGKATLTVKETIQPICPNLHGCEGTGVPSKFTATPSVTGGIVKYYMIDDTAFLIPLPSPSNQYLHNKLLKGDYKWLITQTANGCTSIAKKITLLIDKVNPPQLMMSDVDYYTCLGKYINAIRVQPNSGYSNIQWYNKSNVKVDTGAIFYPNVSTADLSSNVFYVDQTVENCRSLKDTVRLIVIECQETNLMRCNTDSVLDLFTVYNPTNRQYKWQDNNYTGALQQDSIVDLLNTKVKGKNTFQYYNHLINIQVDKQLYSGFPRDTSFYYCIDTIAIDSVIRNFDNGGTWYNGNNVLLINPICRLLSGTNNIRYYIAPKGNCKAKESIITIKTDSLAPFIKCPLPIFHSVEVGQAGYIGSGIELDPTVTDGDCLSYVKIQNSYNGKSTLDSTYFSLDDKSVNLFAITWTATDAFGKSQSCITELSLGTFRIPNLFTPNNDGENDSWIFSLDKSPEAIVHVYNCWGELVFESKGYSKPWDGKLTTGRDVSVGGYTYIISDSNKIIAKGTVTILR